MCAMLTAVRAKTSPSLPERLTRVSDQHRAQRSITYCHVQVPATIAGKNFLKIFICLCHYFTNSWDRCCSLAPSSPKNLTLYHYLNSDYVEQKILKQKPLLVV